MGFVNGLDNIIVELSIMYKNVQQRSVYGEKSRKIMQKTGWRLFSF